PIAGSAGRIMSIDKATSAVSIAIRPTNSPRPIAGERGDVIEGDQNIGGNGWPQNDERRPHRARGLSIPPAPNIQPQKPGALGVGSCPPPLVAGCSADKLW